MSRTYFDPDFEPRVADWLEADPDLAPAPVLSTVLAAFPSIPQRRVSRVPWRFQTMNRFALFGAAAAIVVAVGLGGLALVQPERDPDDRCSARQRARPPGPTPILHSRGVARGIRAAGVHGDPRLGPVRLPPSISRDVEPGSGHARKHVRQPPRTCGRGRRLLRRHDERTWALCHVGAGERRAYRSGHVVGVHRERGSVEVRHATWTSSTCEQSTRALDLGRRAGQRGRLHLPGSRLAVGHGRSWGSGIPDRLAGRRRLRPDYLRPFLDLFLQTFTFTD